jgi:hypothetical protein
VTPIAALPAACADGLRANAARFLAFVGPGPIEFQILGAPDKYAPNRFCHARSTDEALALLDAAEKLSPVGTYLILNAPDEAVTTRAGRSMALPIERRRDDGLGHSLAARPLHRRRRQARARDVRHR